MTRRRSEPRSRSLSQCWSTSRAKPLPATSGLAIAGPNPHLSINRPISDGGHCRGHDGQGEHLIGQREDHDRSREKRRSAADVGARAASRVLAQPAMHGERPVDAR